MKMQSQRGENGFTLIEILISLTILTVAMLALFQGFSTNLQNVETAVAYGEAVKIAESKLAGIGAEIPLIEGEVKGKAEGFDWQVVIIPHETDEQVSEDHPFVLLKVDVTVFWIDPGQKKQSISLTTLRVGKSA
ncbi:MAG: prepilin-type N-terminal cleavage/methylation domain-containing protein [Magnetococcales bacterium]|nr:prepilin-type N-terminal cleavage/methylation domain-containing protein [Magnetococcales bacterium]